jgi:V8-like Glu-specific endopeptidase
MDITSFNEDMATALLQGFNESELTQLVRYDLDKNLDWEVASGGLRDRVFALLLWAERQGIIGHLMVSAFRRRPNNRMLRDLSVGLSKAVLEEHNQLADQASALVAGKLENNAQADKVRDLLGTYKSPGGALEAVVVRVPHLQAGQGVTDFETRLREARSRVCLIRVNGKPMGTGFLVGQDRVMTNAHVIAENVSLATCDAVFDFVGNAKPEALPAYKLAASLARSAEREFDFAIYRLEKIPDGNRGYFKVRPYPFATIREPVSVLGHSNADPMTYSFGVVFDSNSFFGRVAYTANTLPGASGSPVFAENWDLVALHHHGEAQVNNHGVTMKAIVAHLQSAQGASGLLETC